ncbi:hypothetical protein EPI10_006152 [Gossypium australe]|uniref:Uncharacterized protein n=1 Tax=Gossypium australe TaxID=47621 RepID=A0A5B6WQE3_9ROSI|nr:hypothetical protein EPI10_006152 [Gossypium australe]
MEMFYNGLNGHIRMVVDASVNGTLLGKSYNEAYEILERIANNDYQYPTTSVGIDRRVVGAMELDAITSLTTQEMKVAELTCIFYGEDYVFDECPSNPALVYYVGNFNSTTTTHIPTHLIRCGSNIPISVGVIKGWEIPSMLFDKCCTCTTWI